MLRQTVKPDSLWRERRGDEDAGNTGRDCMSGLYFGRSAGKLIRMILATHSVANILSIDVSIERRAAPELNDYIV